MNILLRSVKIIDPNSPFNGRKVDLHIVDGKIKAIDKVLPKKRNAQIIEKKGLHISPAWFDPSVDFCDPGAEYKEDIESGLKAACAGGFTAVGILPNTPKTIDNKTIIDYLNYKALAQNSLCDIYPIGANTQQLDNVHLSEMYEMNRAGAIAFSGGYKPIQQTGTMLRSLQYVLPFDGIIMNLPDDRQVVFNAQMNEGVTSTQMGTKGKPNLAELLMVQRDIELVKYTQSRLHFIQVSTAEAVEAIRKAKAEKIKVSASVSPWHLAYTDEKLIDFNTNWKINPPLRTNKDRLALIEGLKDGTIDFVTSLHRPQDEDCKKLEFDKADFGVIGLQTVFPILNELGFKMKNIVEWLSLNPRKILGLTIPCIEQNAAANFTLFLPKEKFILTEETILSKSKNTPLLNKELSGKVFGVINKGRITLNE